MIKDVWHSSVPRKRKISSYFSIGFYKNFYNAEGIMEKGLGLERIMNNRGLTKGL